MIPFPDKKYSVIYADPPWSYSGGGAARNVAKHYHTMKPEDIYSLPVQNIAADDCLLFLWATFPNLDVALETIRRWGFRYKTAAFVWVKRNRKTPFIDDPARGRLGDYCVACVEAFDQGRPNPIHADDDRVVRCDCFRPIPEPEEEEQKEGEPT